MNWKIPTWWTLTPDGPCFVLARVDGIVLSSFQTEMGLWGWCITEGGAYFVDYYDPHDALIETLEDGTERLLFTVAEAPMAYPDPAEFLPEIDRMYPVEA